MNGRNQMPADILASVLIALLALALEILYSPSSIPAVRYIEYAAAVLLPGHMLVSAIYPGRDDIKGMERAAYTFGTGAVLIVLSSVILYITPWGASLSNVFIFLFAFTILISPFSYLRRSTLPRRRRFSLSSISLTGDAGRWRTSSRSARSGRIMALAAIVLLSASISALVYVDGISDQESKLTELYLLGPNGKAADLPASAVAGKPSTVIVGVANHEFEAVNYTLKLLFNSSILFQKEMKLGHNQTWEHMVSFVLKDLGPGQKLEFMLYKEKDLGSPYKSRYMLINVSGEDGSAKKAIQSVNGSDIKLSIAQNKSPESAPSSSGSGSSSTTARPRTVSQGAVKSKPAPLVVPEEPPTVFGISPDKASPQKAGTRIVWTADASDPDGDLILYRFLLRGTAARDWSSDGSWTWVTDRSDVGRSRIEVQVRDGQHAGAGSYDSSKVAGFTIAESNLPPKADSLTPDQTSPQERGSKILWTAVASDPENDPVLYRFFRNGLPATDWIGENRWTWEPGEGDTGSNVVEVLVRDGKHAGSEGYDDIKSAEFTITGPNTPPIMISLAPDIPSPQRPGTDIVWTAKAEDPQGDPLQYKFSLDGQKASDWQDSCEWTWNTTGLGSGDHHIGVWVRDGKHAGPESFDSQMDARFAVDSSNRLPRVESLLPSPHSPQPMGTTVRWEAEASDMDGDQVLYRFLINGYPATRWTENGNWTWTATATCDIEVRVRDGKHSDTEGFDDNMSFHFVVGSSNAVPIATDLSADPTSPQPYGTAITWTATASDPDEDLIQYRYFLNDSPVSGWSSSNTWTWETDNSSVGEGKVEVRVRDGMHSRDDGFDGSKSASFMVTEAVQKPLTTVPLHSQSQDMVENEGQADNATENENATVKENLAPIIESFGADPSSPQTAGTEIILAARASDPEGDPIQYRFFKNDTPLTGWIDEGKLAWDPKDEDVGKSEIEVRVRDGKHAGADGHDNAMSVEYTITVSNRAPKLTGLISDLDSPQESGVDIAWTASALDDEGDPVQYRYFLNDEPVTEWSQSPSWSWSTYGISSGDYKVMVYARDGKHATGNAFDSSLDTTFTITSFIDREINKIVSKKRSQATPGQGSQLSSIGSGITDQASSSDDKPLTPKKLGR